MAPDSRSSDPATPARPLVIELVGLPGSGKSTVTGHLLDSGRFAGLAVGHRRLLGRGRRNRLAHLGSKARFHMRHRQCLFAALQFGLATCATSWTALRHAIGLASWSHGLQVARQRRFDLLVLDHGPVQESWSVAVSGDRLQREPATAALRVILGGADVDFAFVWLDVSIEVAVERLRGRRNGRSRFDRMDEREGSRLLGARRDDLARLFRDAANSTSEPTCRLNAGQPIPILSSAVSDFIEQRMSLNPRAAGRAGALR